MKNYIIPATSRLIRRKTNVSGTMIAAESTEASSSTDKQPPTQKTTERMEAVAWSLANPGNPRGAGC